MANKLETRVVETMHLRQTKEQPWWSTKYFVTGVQRRVDTVTIVNDEVVHTGSEWVDLERCWG